MKYGVGLGSLFKILILNNRSHGWFYAALPEQLKHEIAEILKSIKLVAALAIASQTLSPNVKWDGRGCLRSPLGNHLFAPLHCKHFATLSQSGEYKCKKL